METLNAKINAIVKDFDPNSEEFKNEKWSFQKGIKFAVNAFKTATCPGDYQENTKQRAGENDKDYQARLRNEIVELMCSNRGYASCFESIK